MAVALSDEKSVALIDTTSGMAFGPVFVDKYEAADFLVFTAQFGRDAREFSTQELMGLAIEYDRQQALDSHADGSRVCYCGDGDHYRGTKTLEDAR